MKLACPTCGNSVTTDLVLKERECILIRGAAIVKLSPILTKILALLLSKQGRFITSNELIGRVFSHRAIRIDAEPNLRVHICRLRKLLKPVDLTIDSKTCHGYRLTILAGTEAFQLRHDGEKRVKHI